MALWIVLYFLIGLIGSCGIQYYKGRKPSCPMRDLELDLLSGAVLAIWPGVIMLGIAVVVLMALAFPVIKLSEWCAKLGRKHRGQN